VEWLDRRFIVVPRSHLSEHFNAPEDTLSFIKATSDSFQTRHLIHENIALDNYHARVIRKTLTQYMVSGMGDIVDEIDSSFQDEFPFTDGNDYRFRLLI
jgi:hypothetical protein